MFLILPFSLLANGHKKANKGNSVKSFVYKPYDTLRARVCVKENKSSYACSTRERERESIKLFGITK